MCPIGAPLPTPPAVVVTRNVGPIITLPIEALSGEKVAVDAWTVLALLWTLGGARAAAPLAASPPRRRLAPQHS